MSELNKLSIEFKHSQDNDSRAEILVDGHPVVDSNYVVDLDELEKSIDYHGKFFILTCESNEPNHINISKGIEMDKDDGDNIRWKLQDSDVTYTFDSHEYRQTILEAVHNWRNIVTDKEEKNQLSYQDIHSYVKYSEQDDEEELIKS